MTGKMWPLIAMALLLAGCSSYSSESLAPVPGSITFNGQPRTKLTKSPIGASFPHTFTDQTGRQVEEIYVIEPDRSLRIAKRHYLPVSERDMVGRNGA